ncbi:hypothetical protein QBC33DRAFT_446891 [Phialemonium atrogriseum]|uniref:MIF4G domain-containing protein n=1 Tax=Phialemonium atrogriseum TaxID=1093897 RepID=A0AAJ0C474_9PEZI|nr:uncharacterized protein QBC33DRAFT_446891 [Phialemonium atrogriseum]KAK1769823.1 hypothetical protein QBC33DRAFT_446891 [Phialemonium atrogriseum]
MTSTASQQHQPQASNSSSTAAASYASAAGATKKSTPTPLIAAGTNPPLVVGSSVPATQNGKSSSASPVNGGRPNIAPAIPVSAAPAVVHGSNLNGAPSDHSRKSSVTISANAPPNHIANGGAAAGSRASIQFGFKDSPAIAHSTPQPSATAPIPIPGGNARIPSPAHSPSPIPKPSASGGRPPSGAPPPNQMTFGSFPGEGDQPALPQNPMAMGPQQTGAHLRRDSQASAHSEIGGHGGPGPNRGGYQGQGGRGGRNFNASYNNQALGYTPNQRFAGHNGGRGGMPSYQGGRGGMPQFPNSPQPPRASPAPAHAIPQHPGTPNMSQAVPMQPPQQFYPPPHMYPPQVNPPLFSNDLPPYKYKKKGTRRDSEKFSNNPRQMIPSQKHTNGNGPAAIGSRRHGRRGEAIRECEPDIGGFPVPPECPGGRAPYDYPPFQNAPLHPLLKGPIDLSPEGGQFEKLLLTTKKQMGNPYQHMPVDNYGRPIMPYQYSQQPVHQYMNQGPPSSSSGFNPQYAGVPYGQGPPGAQPMSRNSSQISERPASSTGQNQTPVIAQGTPQPRAAQATPPAVAAPAVSRPIIIKNAQGEIVDLKKQLKAPASPAPSIQQSKTPPVIASTPTPPPKPSTPAAHTRVESISTNKTAEQVRNEFREQVRKTAEDPVDGKAKEEEVPATPVEKVSVEDKAKEERLKAEEREKAEAEAKATEQARVKAQEEAEAKVKAEAAPTVAPEKKEDKKEEKSGESGDMDEDELERIIREMEEADAKREQQEAERSAKRKAEQEEAKKLAAQAPVPTAEENDRKLREQEREMERLEEERDRQRKENETKAASGNAESVADLLAKKIEDLKLSDKKDSGPSSTSRVSDKLASLTISSDGGSSASGPRTGGSDKPRGKPAALNLVVSTKPVEPPQPSAALQSLRSARFLEAIDPRIYPDHISSPNPALNAAVSRKGKTFKYDAQFLLQFQKVFTEQPSVEFHQQVKSLIGDSDGSRSASARAAGPGSGRQGSKAGTPGGFPSQGVPMGQFISNKTLPPGTTSEQRFAMSQGAMPRPATMANPMASFARPGAFPGSHSMSRSPSSTTMGGIPNSPRQGSRRGGGGGGGSKRGDYGSGQHAKNMPLTQGVELKPITVSATGWKPSSIGNKAAQAPVAAAATAHLDPEMVQRKVKAALNKMTPEKFDKISDQILTIAGQSKNEQDGRTLRQVIQLTFEKATDEAHWASMYAKFCKRMLETMSPEIRDENILDKQGVVVSGGALFRKYLLNRCQEEFERGWKIDLPKPEEGEDGKPGEAALLSDEYYVAAAAKRRGLGLVQFIGELYKLGMLTERIMHECVRKLLEFQGIPDEAEIESLTKLLRTIGANLDSTEKGRPMMDAYFQRMQSIIDLPDLPSRLKFMLMDIVDLRRVRWASKEANKGPKTLEEVRAEAEAAAAQKAAENARSSQRGPPGGRSHTGRGDGRNFSAYNQPVPNQVGMDDLRRLKGTANRSSSQNVSFGPTSMFNSRSNSGRRLAPGGSFGRAGEDSGASSRTGTPPTRERDSVAHTNVFG